MALELTLLPYCQTIIPPVKPLPFMSLMQVASRSEVTNLHADQRLERKLVHEQRDTVLTLYCTHQPGRVVCPIPAFPGAYCSCSRFPALPFRDENR